MNKQVGILILHGIGTQKQGYAQPLIDGIKAKLSQEEVQKVAFNEVLYADIFDNYQQKREDYLENTSHGWQFLTRLIRRVLIFVLSDATSYKDKSAYQEIQQRLSQNIADLQAQLPVDAPVIIAAHSLGTMVISDYIYDEQEGKNAGLGLAKIGNLKALISLACNIPLFEMGHKRTLCIKAPTQEFFWRNFFSPFDVLAYKVADYYDERPAPKFDIQDKEIFCGGLFTAWNVFSHLGYWKSSAIHTELSTIARKYLS